MKEKHLWLPSPQVVIRLLQGKQLEETFMQSRPLLDDNIKNY